METIIAILLSVFFGFVPMLLFASLVYWMDRYEKEPKILLGVVFIWGAVIAAGAAFIINTLLGLGVYIFTGSDLITEISTGSIFAPLIEEFLKGVAVIFVFIFFRNEFDSIMDGIVYAAITALGFAATENAYYIFTMGYLEGGYAGLIGLVLIRVVLVGWQHPFYTAFFGIGLALARLSKNLAIKILAPLLGLGISISAHALHNTVAAIAPGLIGLATTTLLDWSGWIFMFLFIIWAVYRERRWIINHLKEEVSLGIITTNQYQTACSAWRQSYIRLVSLFHGKFRTTHRFYKLTAELAYKKQQRSSFGEEKGNTALINRYRDELSHLSPIIAAKLPQK